MVLGPAPLALLNGVTLFNRGEIFTAPAPLNPILLLFNRGETSLCLLFNWGMQMTSKAYFTGVVKLTTAN